VFEEVGQSLELSGVAVSSDVDFERSTCLLGFRVVDEVDGQLVVQLKGSVLELVALTLLDVTEVLYHIKILLI